MVDPESLTAGALADVFVVKAIEQAGEKVVDGGTKACIQVRNWLPERFSANDVEAREALARVEEVPDSLSRVRVLAELIDRHAEDTEFRTELGKLLENAKSFGLDMHSVSQIAQGAGIVQIAHTENSHISVNQGARIPNQLKMHLQFDTP